MKYFSTFLLISFLGSILSQAQGNESFTLLNGVEKPSERVRRPAKKFPDFQIISTTEKRKKNGTVKMCAVMPPFFLNAEEGTQEEVQAAQNTDTQSVTGPETLKLTMLEPFVAKVYPSKKSVIELLRADGPPVRVWSNVNGNFLRFLNHFEGPNFHHFTLPMVTNVDHPAKVDIPKDIRKALPNFRAEGPAYINLGDTQLSEQEIECLDGLHILYEQHFRALKKADKRRQESAANPPTPEPDEPQNFTFYFWEGESRPLTETE